MKKYVDIIFLYNYTSDESVPKSTLSQYSIVSLPPVSFNG